MGTPHKTLPASECHEDKHIISSSTLDAGKVITPSATTPGTGELRLLQQAEIVADASRQTGLATSTIQVEVVKKSIFSIGPNASQIVTVELGAPAAAAIKRVFVRHAGGGGVIHITTADASTINGWPLLYLVSQHDAVELATDGVEWFVLSTNMMASGYQFIRDSQYTSGAPLSVLAGARVKGTLNNLGAGQEAYADPRFDLFDQVNQRIKFTKPGDVMTIRLAWRAKMAAANGYFDLETSFPAPITATNITTEYMTKGAGVENRFIREYTFYLDDFAMSQGYLEIWLTPSVNMDFYGASLLLMVTSRRPFGGNG